MMLHIKYQDSRICVSDKKILSTHLENLFLACVTLICNGLEPFE